MADQGQATSGVVRVLVVIGLAMSVVGGLAIALSWERHAATVWAGTLLVAAGQALALLGLAGPGAVGPPGAQVHDAIG